MARRCCKVVRGGALWQCLRCVDAHLKYLLMVTSVIASALVSAFELPDARERWIEVQTDNFTIYSNAREGTAKQIGVDLERLRTALEQIFSDQLESPVPTAIYVFKNDRSLRRYKYFYNGAPAPVAGYFVSRPTGNYVAIDGGSDRRSDLSARNIVYHEYLHEVLRNNEPHLPLWMNEGLAEYFSTFESDGEKVKIGLPIRRHVQWLRSHDLLPISQLFSVDHDSELYNDQQRAGVFYAQSWALTHYLYLGSKVRRGEYARYAALIGAGTTRDVAFAEAFGTDQVALGRELKSYIEQSRFAYRSLAIATRASAPTVRVLQRHEVLYRLGDLAAELGPQMRASADAHLRAALALAPEHTPAMARLAGLRLAGGDKAALVDLARAAGRAPNDFRIQYQYGTALLEAAVGVGVGVVPSTFDDATRQSVRTARSALARAVELRPGLLEGWAQLSFASMLVDLPAAATIAVQRTAHRLLPDRYDVTINLAKTLAKLNREGEARELLVALTADTADTDRVAAARDALFELDLRALHALADADDLDAALAFAEQMSGNADAAAHRAVVEDIAGRLDRQIAADHFTTQFNKAVTAANARQYRHAVAILDALRFLATEPEQLEAVYQLREHLRAVVP